MKFKISLRLMRKQLRSGNFLKLFTPLPPPPSFPPSLVGNESSHVPIPATNRTMSSPMLSGRPRKFIFRIISHAYFPRLDTHLSGTHRFSSSPSHPPPVFPCRDSPAKFLYTTLEADTFSFATRQTSSSVIRSFFSFSFKPFASKSE